MHDLSISHSNYEKCAGNRRKEMGAVKKVHGIAWESGVIANAKWAGVRLSDVLQQAGIQAHNAAHVSFASHATLCQDDDYYGASIPLAKAQNQGEDVLLAFEVCTTDCTTMTHTKLILRS